MPQLIDKNIVEVRLPSYPKESPAIVHINTIITVGDLDSVPDSLSNIGKTVFQLSKLIVDWDLLDEKGEVLPITIENIRRLRYVDLNAMAEVITLPSEENLTTDEKKS